MSSPITHNLTILLTDIKGFTDKTSRKSRLDIQDMLEKHKHIVLPVLQGRGGRLIKTIGDAFLMVFESPTDAVLAGIAVQEALAQYNAGKEGDDRIEIRIAINLGEVNLTDNDIFGEPVNITARIEAVAEAGEVFFTEAVYLAMNKKEVPSSEVGLLQLKGIPEKIRVYKVKREHPVGGPSQASGTAPAAPHSWTPGASNAAPAIGDERRPKASRRALALFADAFICTLIVGSIFKGDRSHRHTHGFKVDDSGIHVDAGSAAQIHVDDAGVHINAGGSKISIDDSGVSVGDSKEKMPLKAAEKAAREIDRKFEYEYEEQSRWTAHSFAFPVIWALYSALFLTGLGATPGKHIFRLKVVRHDGGPITFRQAALRALGTLISGYALFLGFIWALWEPEKRGWHDLIAGTKVEGRLR